MLNIIGSLSGTAWKLLVNYPTEDIEKSGAFEKILKILDKAFENDKTVQLPSDFTHVVASPSWSTPLSMTISTISSLTTLPEKFKDGIFCDELDSPRNKDSWSQLKPLRWSATRCRRRSSSSLDKITKQWPEVDNIHITEASVEKGEPMLPTTRVPTLTPTWMNGLMMMDGKNGNYEHGSYSHATSPLADSYVDETYEDFDNDADGPCGRWRQWRLCGLPDLQQGHQAL